MPPRRAYVGTSGWTYDDWTGPFYPPDVRGSDRLPFYARHFDTVEVNASFYRVPAPAAVDAWNERLPGRFRLVLKGSRQITHRSRLKDCDEPLEFFLDRVLELRNLKVILWQLPPSLHLDPELLDRFLARLPRSVRHAVEFRHASWWDRETDDVLRRHRAAFVAVSHPRLPSEVRRTTDLVYVRFHGLGSRLYDYDYSLAELRTWERRLRPHRGRRTIYAFFNNDFEANAPRNARTFMRMLGARGGSGRA